MLRKKLALNAVSLTAVLLLVALAFYVHPAQADSNSVDFEPETYTTGDIDGQDGWVHDNGNNDHDVAVVNNSDFFDPGSSPYPSFGQQSLRMSNAVTSGAFDWVYAKPLSEAAGETGAGAAQPFFEAEWDIASALPGDEQPGLQIAVSPDPGNGGRMSYIRFNDSPGGLDVYFSEFLRSLDDFNETQIAFDLDRQVPHNVRITMNFVEGPNESSDPENDIVCVYIDDVLTIQGTSWENYFRDYDPPLRIADSLLFIARDNQGTAPETSGRGFLFDNINLTSGPVPSDYEDGCPDIEEPADDNTNNDDDEQQPSSGGSVTSADEVGGSTGGAITTSNSVGAATDGTSLGTVYGSALVVDGKFVADPGAIGILELLQKNIIQAVNLYGLMPGGASTFDFVHPLRVCMRGAGTVYYVDAETHTIQTLPSVTGADGYTCADVPAAGIVLLIGS